MPNLPAFPQPMAIDQQGCRNYPYEPEQGLSMRDYFAAAALPAVISAYVAQGKEISKGELEEWLLAERAYDVADAMLRAREAQ